MTELAKAFQAGDVETFKRLLPSINFCDINIMNICKTLFVAEKYFEQKEMMNMIKELQ